MSKKVQVLTRNPYDFQRETKFDIHKIARNPDESLHPFAVDREYIRASNSCKIQRMLSKPFVRSFDGALDDVQIISLDPRRVSLAAFGTADGRLEYWNISRNIKLCDFKCLDGIMTGVSHFSEGTFLTCGSDKIVRHWDFKDESDFERWECNVEPKNSFTIEDDPRCLHTQIFGTQFAIGTNDQVLIYKSDIVKSEPIARYMNPDRYSVHYVKFHPTERDIVCSLTGDNKINLYDIRTSGVAAELKMAHKSTSMSFNPQLPTFFTTASNDYNLYTFDIRYFSKPIRIHTGFVKAVSDISYSHSGTEFVAGGVDKTIRIYKKDDSLAREIYTNKRMGRIFNVRYSYDDQYVLSASGDHNVRLWKAQGHAKLGAITPREKRSLLEAEQLRKKFADKPEIQKIQNRRRVPNVVKVLGAEHKIIEKKHRRKERNIKMHAPPGSVTLPNKFEKAVYK